MAFVTTSAAVHARRAPLGAPVCARTAPQTVRVSMTAGTPEKQSLSEWLLGKFMHNALWEGDQEVGYEPFFKKAEFAREAEYEKLYKEEKDAGK